MVKKVLLVTLFAILCIIGLTSCCQHEFTETVAPPTCDAEGYTLHTCTKCGEENKTDPVPALGHTYVAGAQACADFVCEICGGTKPSEVAHTFTSTVIAPTCTEGGYTHNVCSVCSAETRTDILPATGHAYTSSITRPTCTRDGFTLEVCSVCDTITKSNIVPASGHDYEDTVIEPTCKREGYTMHTCRVCRDTYRDSKIETTDHSYAQTVVAPTCKAEGYTEHTCTACGDTYRDAVTEKVDHEYDGQDPCYLRSCVNCDAFLLPEHDDVLIKTVVAPTLAAEGRGLFRCNNCKREAQVAIPAIKPANLGIPVIYLTGSMSGMSKENDKVLSVVYESKDLNFECVAEMHWQGASSVGYAKKNYTIKFYRDETLQKKYKFDPFGWGAESKYCLKANWVDFSQSRNVVGGRLWGDVCAMRTNLDSHLQNAPNYGAIDGMPVVVYHDGQFLGLYTMNIPKDEWMFGMEAEGEDSREAILFTNDWGRGPSMHEPVASGFSNGWDLEYCSTTDTEWVRTSMNQLINFVNTYNGYQFKRNIGNYLDVEATIDVMLFTYAICARDNSAKNILWATYDGVKWIPSVYDMDGTFGMFWNGQFTNTIQDMTPSIRSDGSVSDGVDNALWQKMFDNFADEIKARWFELREEALSMENIENRFDEFFASVPPELYEAEKQRWPNVPSHSANTRDQIINFTRDRLNYIDSVLEKI